MYNDKTTWNPQKDTSFRTGDIAFLSVNAGTGVYLFKEKMHLQLMVNYIGEKYTGVGTTVANNPTGVIPSFLMMNASIHFNISKYFNFQIRANNLLDQYYISPGIRTGAGTQSSFVPQPGRNFNGTMNFFF
jgi:outer membrane receptor protein involved in Fe transport